MNGKLSSLTILELDKYLDENALTKKGKKGDKIKAIVADVLRKSNDVVNEIINGRTVEADYVSGDDSDDHDIVMNEVGSSSEESDLELDEHDSEHDKHVDENESALPLVVTTRYGRHAGSWNHFQLN